MAERIPPSPDEVVKLLKTAKARNVLIPYLLDNNMVYMPRDPKREKRALFVVGTALRKGVGLTGEHNLAEAEKLSSDGEKVTFVFNHQSDLDTGIVKLAIEKRGYTGLSHKMVYPAGIKMFERLHTKFFLGGADSVMIVSIPETNLLRNAVSNLDKLRLDDYDEMQLMEYSRNAALLSAEAGVQFNNLLGKGFHKAIFPEGTRSRSGFVERAYKETAAAVGREGWIVPGVISGGYEMLPPGNSFLVNALRLAVRGGKAHLTVGKPFPASEIWRKYRSEDFPGNKATAGDLLLAPVAQLNPSLVRPADRELYEILTSIP